jgi:hypothetical protein
MVGIPLTIFEQIYSISSKSGQKYFSAFPQKWSFTDFPLEIFFWNYCSPSQKRCIWLLQFRIREVRNPEGNGDRGLTTSQA